MKKSVFLKLILVGVLSGYFTGTVVAQNTRPFWNEILEFKHKDQISMPGKHGIVFLGSSSIRKWTNAETTFKLYGVINRGFGGSTLTQAIDYVPDLVTPYTPRQVVVYSGENDIASGTVSAAETLKRLKLLVTKIRTDLPFVPIVFLSIKQSPSRLQYSAIVLEANKLIRQYLTTVTHTAYVDVNTKMLDNKGKTRPELFESDMLHLKPNGYAIWEKELKPYLIK
jgi:lysophospholipase L1-like esterase